MERKINEVFDFKDHKLQVVEHEDCLGCFFNNKGYNKGCLSGTNYAGECSCYDRNDRKSVIFKKYKQ